MNYYEIAGYFDSSNGINKIAYYIYIPTKCKPCGIVQISHGMCEYIHRYAEFADFLTGNGFIVCGNDHLGHGNSIDSEDDLGYFAPELGWTFLPKDLKKMTEIIKAKYPNLPIFLFGHSMGSFAARAYIAKFSYLINGTIICGTSGGELGTNAGIALTKSMVKLKGDRFRSDKINHLLFGAANERIEDSDNDFAWVSRDKSIVEKYSQDKKCCFIFTTRGFYDLLMLLDYVSNDSWAGKLRKDLPIFLISGDADPIGGYGKGVSKVYNSLIDENILDVKMKLYEGGRHEIINEINRSEVYQDILNWLESKLEN